MMAGALEIGVVIAIVGAAAWHAMRTFMPRTWRKRAAGTSELKANSDAASCNTGCGTCGGCDAGGTNGGPSRNR